jgi:hypothetical protein
MHHARSIFSKPISPQNSLASAAAISSSTIVSPIENKRKKMNRDAQDRQDWNWVSCFAGYQRFLELHDLLTCDGISNGDGRRMLRRRSSASSFSR